MFSLYYGAMSYMDQLSFPIIYLAPMSGITNQAYRKIVKSFASDVVFPEFVSINALYHGSSKTEELLHFNESERPIVAQLFGSEPELFHAATVRVKALGFDGVDINFGCPAPKVAKNGGGCALLGDLGRCRAIIQAVIDAAGPNFPVSVKTRISYRKVPVRDFCRMVSDLPLSHITIHGRPFETPYLGPANLDCIKEAKTLVPFKVIASGHGHTPEAAKETLDYTGADGIAVARGTFGRPWLIQQIKEYLATGTYWKPTQIDILNTMLQHARLASDLPSERPFLEIRKVLGWYIRNIPHAASFRAQLMQVNTFQDVEQIAEHIRLSMDLNHPSLNYEYVYQGTDLAIR